MIPASKVFDRQPIDLLFTPDFTAEELMNRRHRIAEDIGKDAHLLIAGAAPVPYDALVQDANFYYFCGLDVPQSYLLIEGGTGRTTVFLPSRKLMAGAPEDCLGFEDGDMIAERLKLDAALPASELTATLSQVKHLYTPFAETEGGGATVFGANGCARNCEADEWDQVEPRHKRRLRLLKERFPSMDIEDALPLIRPMRTIKSPAEIEVLRQAGSLSANIMIESMKATRPGMNENRLQAIAEYVFRDQGRCAPGYGIIAAGGKRTWNGHYNYNNMTLKEDEIILMDCGPDFRHYSSDIARMWPVNGTFSDWHRQVYGMIVAYHKTLLSLIRPGTTAKEVYDESAARMVALCEDPSSGMKGMEPLVEQMIERGVGYLNHGVGLSVHDAIDPGWKNAPLREGFVCALDPMIWCEPQHEYIRVEDTIVVTTDGCERLTGGAPFEIDEIEKIVGIG